MSKSWLQQEKELAQINADLDKKFPETIERIGRGVPKFWKKESFYKGEGKIIENGSKVAFGIVGNSGGVEIVKAKIVINYDKEFKAMLNSPDEEKLNRARYKLIAYKHS